MVRAGKVSLPPSRLDSPSRILLGARHAMTAPHPIIPGVRFKDIDGWPGYCVGDDGSVWSRRLGVNASGQIRSPWLSLRINVERRRGYCRVILCRNKVMRTSFVHRIVLEAFRGPCPDGWECRHLDGNPRNNRLGNLAWGTSSENKHDAIRHGTSPYMPGENHPNAVLTDAVVREVIRLRQQEEISARRIANRLGIKSEGTIQDVLLGYTWNHITGFPKKRNVSHRPHI